MQRELTVSEKENSTGTQGHVFHPCSRAASPFAEFTLILSQLVPQRKEFLWDEKWPQGLYFFWLIVHFRRGLALIFVLAVGDLGTTYCSSPPFVLTCREGWGKIKALARFIGAGVP
jgi:hypothetical protein